MAYSKITKKGQLTVPINIRKKYRLEPGTRVIFQDKKGDLIIKRLPDITESGGSLAKYEDAGETIRHFLRGREQPWR